MIGQVVKVYMMFEMVIILHLSYKTKFDLPVKWVKVNLGSTFEQNIMGKSTQCYIPGFLNRFTGSGEDF